MSWCYSRHDDDVIDDQYQRNRRDAGISGRHLGIGVLVCLINDTPLQVCMYELNSINHPAPLFVKGLCSAFDGDSLRMGLMFSLT